MPSQAAEKTSASTELRRQGFGHGIVVPFHNGEDDADHDKYTMVRVPLGDEGGQLSMQRTLCGSPGARPHGLGWAALGWVAL